MIVSMNFLAEIIVRKRGQVSRATEAVPLSELTELARAARKDAMPVRVARGNQCSKQRARGDCRVQARIASQGDIRRHADAGKSRALSHGMRHRCLGVD